MKPPRFAASALHCPMCIRGTGAAAAAVVSASLCMVLVQMRIISAPAAARERVRASRVDRIEDQSPRFIAADRGAKSTEARIISAECRPPQALTHRFIDEAVVLPGGFPAHSAQQADGFHGMSLYQSAGSGKRPRAATSIVVNVPP